MICYFKAIFLKPQKDKHIQHSMIFASVMCLYNSKPRSVSKKEIWSSNVSPGNFCVVCRWPWLCQKWEMLQQWMWTSVYDCSYRYIYVL